MTVCVRVCIFHQDLWTTYPNNNETVGRPPHQVCNFCIEGVALLLLLVKEVLAQTTGAGTLESGDHVRELLDGLHLLLQELVLKHLGEVRVVVP